MAVETLDINGMQYPVKVYYENRKDCRASIGKRSVNIRIPRLLDRKEKF